MRHNSKSNRGVGLIEVVIAIMILVIVMIGGSLSFFHARNQIHLQKQSRAAVQLTSQKLEELKAANYDDIAVGDANENLALDDLSCRRKIEAELVGAYKKVKVTTTWTRKDREHNVSLVTFIAPK
jgi:Tfp pilus assembly protein PilV